MTAQPHSIGVIGVGDIASHLIKGLRRAGDRRPIALFPRNAARAAVLAQDCQCAIAEDRRDFVQRADIVMLCVPPGQVAAALEGFDLPRGTILLSVVGAVPISTLRGLAGPEPEIVRIMPSMACEVGAGAIPIFPRQEVLEHMLSCLGTVFPVASEEALIPATAATCTHGWFYLVFDALAAQLAAAGLPSDQARCMVLQNAAGAVEMARNRPDLTLSQIMQAVAKPGTFTKLGLEELERGRMPHLLGATTDLIAKKLRQAG